MARVPARPCRVGSGGGLFCHASGRPDALPQGGALLLGIELTAHAGHIMGAGHNRLLVYEDEAGSWVRATGAWNVIDWRDGAARKLAGRHAQHAFWGQGAVDRLSMLHQLARNVA